MDHDQQPDSAGNGIKDETPSVHLLDLPLACLLNIVRRLDEPSRRSFCCASKGTPERPGCALLLLLVYARGLDIYPGSTAVEGMAKKAQLPHHFLAWASRQGLHLHNKHYCDDAGVDDYLNTLVGPGRDRSYAGVVSLELIDLVSNSLIPKLLLVAFPNLMALQLRYWSPRGGYLRLGPVVKHGLEGITHVEITAYRKSRYTVDLVGSKSVVEEFSLEIAQFIGKQLSYLPSLTSLTVHSDVLKATPAATLGRLTHLELRGCNSLTPELLPALSACTRLQQLNLCGKRRASLTRPVLLERLPQLACEPNEVTWQLSYDNIHHLLAIPNLTCLRVAKTLHDFPDDWSNAPCAWRQLHFEGTCTSDIARLPLHALDSPVQCKNFRLYWDAPPRADMLHHLRRCGGIRLRSPVLYIDGWLSRSVSHKQARQLLQAWASCLSPVKRVVLWAQRGVPLVQATVAKLWPEAVIDFPRNQF